jgi:glycosyltransferase involved in cell wall biosynthesis/tetratricopeptide (TPR) repeat protein
MTSASSDGETVRAAIAATSLGRLEEAVDGWAALITAGRFASIASIMLLDCARRCGRFEDMALQEPFVESVLGGTEYFKLHREQVETVEQRRLALNVPETLDNLSADELSRIGRAANESQYWRYALQVWTDFLDRAGDPREGMRRIAQCYAALGIHSEAIVYFNEAQRLAPSDQIAQKLDRSKRLESRVRDGFHKHAQRLRDHAAMLALQQAFPQLVARDPVLAATVASDLSSLATATGGLLLSLNTTALQTSAMPGNQSSVLSRLDLLLATPAVKAPRYTPPARLQTTDIADIPLFVSAAYREVLADLNYPEAGRDVEDLFATHNFDTVMFVANAFLIDPRVVKTAMAVSSLGRRVLAVGLCANDAPQAYEIKALSDGIPLLLLPNMNRPINIAMRAKKFPTGDRGTRMELWLATMGIMLTPILAALKADNLVLHTHDYHGLYVGGLAMDKSRLRGNLRWLHDVHEFIRQYDIIDPGLQAAGTAWEEHFIGGVDELSTVSEELGDRLVEAYRLPSPPTIIYSSNRLAAFEKYHGPKSREKLGLSADKTLLVHSGNIVAGRGVDLVVRALPTCPDAHLLLITESRNAYVDELQRMAADLGVQDRIHWHGYLPYDEAMGFMSDADIGIIPMDRYGNTDVALPNKLFDYVLAGLPIVSSNADAMVRFLQDWPIGVIFEEKNSADFTEKLNYLLANLPKFRVAIRSNMERVFACSWEMQTAKLVKMYQSASAKR